MEKIILVRLLYQINLIELCNKSNSWQPYLLTDLRIDRLRNKKQAEVLKYIFKDFWEIYKVVTPPSCVVTYFL